MPPDDNDPTLSDIQRMGTKEFRTYTYMKLNSIDHSVKKIDARIWWVLGSVVALGVVAITAAVI